MDRSQAIVLTLVLIFCTASLGAQSYLIRNYTEEDGLPSSFVYDVVQHPDGRIWLATRSGVAVYDGLRFETFELPNPKWSDLVVDGRGDLWALSDTPRILIAHFDGVSWSTVDVEASPGRNPTATSLAVLRKGSGPPTLAVGSRDGLRIRHKGKWRNLVDGDGWVAGAVYDLEVEGGQIYAATDRGLCIVTPDTLLTFLESPLDPNPVAPSGTTRSETRSQAVAIESTPEGPVLWLRGEGWIARRTGDGQWRSLVALEDDPAPYSLLQPDGRGGVWYSHQGKIFHFDSQGRTDQALGHDSGQIESPPTSLLLDREGLLWIGSERGLSKLVSRRFANYDRRHGLMESEVTAVAQLDSGTMVLGHNGGLSWLSEEEPKGDSFTTPRIRTLQLPGPSEPIFSHRVMDLRVDSEGRLWGALSELGLAEITEGGLTHRHGATKGLVGNISSLAFDPGGDLWVGGDQGLFLGRAVADRTGAWLFEEVATDLPTAYIRRLATSHQGILAAATLRHGVYLRSADGAWHQLLSSEDAANATYTVYFDEDDKLWVGTSIGLFRQRGEVLERFRSHGLANPQRPVYLLIEDAAGALWMGTDNGVARWEGERWHPYGVRQGLPAGETNRGGGVLDSRGRLWLGTSRGVSRYQPELDHPPEPPHIDLTRIEIGDRSLPLDQPSVLSFGENSPIFHYRALSFVDEDAIEVGYRLLGLEDQWVVRAYDRQTASLSNLPKGRYQLELRARLDGGEWGPVVRSPELTVREPFWNSFWFLAASGSTLVLLLAFGIQLMGARRTSRRLEDEVYRRTLELEQKRDELEASHRKLSNYVDRLQREIAEHEKTENELLKAKSIAEAASRSKSRFLATMSHEIRTPMNGVIGMTGLLLETTLTGEQRDQVETIRKSGETLLAIINDVLDYSKIEAGKLDLQNEPFDLRVTVRDVFDLFAVQAAGKGIALESRIDPSVPPWVEGDDARIRQILINLVGNGLKFTEEGSIEITARRRQREGEAPPPADAVGQPLRLEISVRDTGIGIAADQQDRLFEVFSQADSSVSRRYGGTGLGLAIARRLVQHMGGEIWTESRLGEGSQFFFTLPTRAATVVAKEVAQGTASVDPGMAKRLPLRILVADDNGVNQRVAVAMLQRMGYRADVAGDGREVLEALDRARYDLILMDIQMPEMDGLEASRAIRKRWPSERQPHIIAMTAHVLKEKREECRQAGMDDFLSKPVTLAALQAALERSIESPAPDTRPDAASAQEADEPKPKGLLGPNGLTDLRALGERVFARVIAAALHDLPETVQKIRRALDEDDLEALGRHVHFLKGTIVTLGAHGVVEHCLDLERKIARRDGTPVFRLTEDLCELTEVLCSELEREAPDIETSTNEEDPR